MSVGDIKGGVGRFRTLDIKTDPHLSRRRSRRRRRARTIAMRQPVGQRPLALRSVGSPEQVDHPWASLGGGRGRIQAIHGEDDRNEPLEAKAAQRPPLKPADRRLVEARTPAEVPLRPVEGKSAALHHRADHLPTGLDLGVSFTPVRRRPGHRCHGRVGPCTRGPPALHCRSPDVAQGHQATDRRPAPEKWTSGG
jgi:hypothetical protein